MNMNLVPAILTLTCFLHAHGMYEQKLIMRNRTSCAVACYRSFINPSLQRYMQEYDLLTNDCLDDSTDVEAHDENMDVSYFPDIFDTLIARFTLYAIKEGTPRIRASTNSTPYNVRDNFELTIYQCSDDPDDIEYRLQPLRPQGAFIKGITGTIP